MKTLQRMLIVAGALVLAIIVSKTLHESGHLAAAELTGGQAETMHISPLGWSSARSTGDYERNAMAWAGGLTEAIGGLVIFLTVWALRLRLSFWALMLAVVCLISTGVYWIGSVATYYGDTSWLVTSGAVPRVAPIVLGSVWIALGFVVALPGAALLGIGRGRTRLWTTVLVMALPVLLYAVVGYFQPDRRRLPWEWVTVAWVVVPVAAAVLLHFVSRWFNGPETARRAAPVSWKTAIATLLVAAAVTTAAVVLFPEPTPDRWLHARWIDDASRYVISERSSEPDYREQIPVTFHWRLGNRAGEFTVPAGFYVRVTWSPPLERFVVVSGSGVYLVNPATGDAERVYSRGRLWAGSSAFNADATRLGVSGAENPWAPGQKEPPRHFIAVLDLTAEQPVVKEWDVGGWVQPEFLRVDDEGFSAVIDAIDVRTQKIASGTWSSDELEFRAPFGEGEYFNHCGTLSGTPVLMRGGRYPIVGASKGLEKPKNILQVGSSAVDILEIIDGIIDTADAVYLRTRENLIYRLAGGPESLQLQMLGKIAPHISTSGSMGDRAWVGHPDGTVHVLDADGIHEFELRDPPE